MGQTTLTPHLAENCPCPTQSLLGGNLPWGSVGFKGTWKRKACSLSPRAPPAPTIYFAFPSLSLPGRTGDSPFLNKRYPTSPHQCALLGFFHLEYKNQDLWSQTAPVLLTFVAKPARRNWLMRSQYAISANLYFNPSFSVLWYHASPPDASEPNTLQLG
jgi:hypothetical protein